MNLASKIKGKMRFRSPHHSCGESEIPRLRAAPIKAICNPPPPCSLRLAAQDVALSRRKQGFESPRERHVIASTVAIADFFAVFV